jgi:hypothetical protein
VIPNIIRLLQEEQRKLEVSTLTYPDPEKYQMWVGRHQGLQLALDIVDEVLRGTEED